MMWLLFPLWVFFFGVVSSLMGMPFYTLLERKILSYVQNRKGPNKVSIKGILQPIADGLKLVIKSSTYLNSKIFIYWVSCILFFFMMILSWLFIPTIFYSWDVLFSVVVVMCMKSVSVYSVLSSGWSSKSKYSLLGSIRASAQTVSYEVSLFLLLLFPCVFLKILSINKFSFKYSFILFSFMIIPWLMSILAETKRAPFDFAEGESELVSGFNTEYSSVGFVFLFLGEYGLILFFSVLTSFLFLKFISKFCFFILVMKFYLFSRSSYPRFRYDFLMGLVWKMVLPWLVLLYFLIFVF